MKEKARVLGCRQHTELKLRCVGSSGGPAATLSSAESSPLPCGQVASYPYDPTVMHFMDYRDVGLGNSSPEFDAVPTFLYAMPLSPNKVFFEV